MTLIGYKGTPVERWASWNAMLNYKGSHKLFKNNPGSWEQRVAARDKDMFDVHLKHYVRGDSYVSQVSQAC